MKDKKDFSPEEKYLMHEGGTERPFDNEYWNNFEQGKYSCRSCNQILFSSETKIDSTSAPCGLQGWPAFGDAIEGSISFKRDLRYGLDRTEALCSKCGIHLGHVFDDVEGKGTRHFCVNSCSLDFSDEDQKNQE